MDYKNKNILVVDDDLPVLSAILDKLSQEGFLTLNAKDGEEGLAITEKNHPDLVIIDILLPKMDGLALMEKIRLGSKWGKNVPIVLLTNLTRDNSDLNEKILKHKPDLYLVKTDISLSEVVKKVKQVLAKRVREPKEITILGIL